MESIAFIQQINSSMMLNITSSNNRILGNRSSSNRTRAKDWPARLRMLAIGILRWVISIGVKRLGVFLPGGHR